MYKNLPALGVVLVVLVRRVGQRVVHVALQVPALLVLEHQLGDELGREGDQKGLEKDFLFYFLRFTFKDKFWCVKID